MLLLWPMPYPRTWLQYVYEAETDAELKALRKSSVCGTACGDPEGVAQPVKKLGLESTSRNLGRPKAL
jgi:hypothetical protein